MRTHMLSTAQFDTSMKELYVTVTSGLCNRLFVVLSGLRLCERHGHTLSVFWTERTGRKLLPYVGSVASGWDDYFQPLPGVWTFAVTGHPTFQDAPVALDMARWETTVVPLGEPGLFSVPRAMANYLESPRVVDPTQRLVIVRGETLPFGTAADGMERHLRYATAVGVYRKDAFLTDLSHVAKRLVPRNIGAIRAVRERLAARYTEFWGIHVRGTDLVQRTKVDRRAAVEQIIRSAPAGVGVFVASDEPLAWLADHANVATYDNPQKYENSVAGVQHALVDLYTLAACTRLFGTSGSSFGMMAWILSDADEYTVHS